MVKVDAGVGRLARLSAALSSAACRRIRSMSRASQRSLFSLSIKIVSKVDGSMQRRWSVIISLALLNSLSTMFEVGERCVMGLTCPLMRLRLTLCSASA